MPTNTTSEASTASDPVASVRRALKSITPTVTMWRDGLTVIPLASALPSEAPEYLTLDHDLPRLAAALGHAGADPMPLLGARYQGDSAATSHLRQLLTEHGIPHRFSVI